jgi:phosphoribosylamine-glycine ligase
MILRLLANPLATLLATVRNQKLAPRFVSDRKFGASLTLAGHGYPYVQLQAPPLPVDVVASLDRDDCDVWWSEVARDGDGRLLATGHRIADVIGFGGTLASALGKAYKNIQRLRCLGSYYRTDIGKSLWPPGRD